MTETPAETPVQPLDGQEKTREAVYDHAELHYVDAVKDETAKQTAAYLKLRNEGTLAELAAATGQDPMPAPAAPKAMELLPA